MEVAEAAEIERQLAERTASEAAERGRVVSERVESMSSGKHRTKLLQ